MDRLTIMSTLLGALSCPVSGAYLSKPLEMLCKLGHATSLILLFLEPGNSCRVIQAWASPDLATATEQIPQEIPPGCVPQRSFRLLKGKTCTGYAGGRSLILGIHSPTGEAVGILEWHYSGYGMPDKDMIAPLVQEGLSISTVFGILWERYVSETRLIESIDPYARQYQFLDHFLGQTHDLIITMLPDGTLLDMNNGGKMTLGYHAKSLPDHLQFINPDFATFMELIQNEGMHEMEIVLEDANHYPKYFQGNFQAENDQFNTVVLVHGICKDVSDYIELQKELMNSNRELTQVNDLLKTTQTQVMQNEKLASIGQLAAGIAHEINNPLGFIKSNHDILRTYLERIYDYIGWMESEFGIGSSKRQEKGISNIILDIPQLLKESTSGYDRIITIIQALKNFSRSGTAEERAPVMIDTLIKDTVTISRNSWKYVAEIVMDLHIAEPVMVYGNLINQVLLNLIVNAAQAIESSCATTLGHITIKSYLLNESAVIEIQDDGPGIPEDVMPHIFNAFYTTKPIGSGTGLGLSIAYDIVAKKHGGTLHAKNLPEGGVRFTIHIPLESSDLLEA